MPVLTVWTIGHSTRPLDELVALLRAHAIDTLVDIRTVPRSRRHPHFERAALTEMLARRGRAVALPPLAPFRRARRAGRACPARHGRGEPAAHVLTPLAHRDGVRLTYPPPQGELAFS